MGQGGQGYIARRRTVVRMLSKLAKSWTRESFVSLRFQAKAFTRNGESVLWWDCRHANGMDRQTPPVARNPSLSPQQPAWRSRFAKQKVSGSCWYHETLSTCRVRFEHWYCTWSSLHAPHPVPHHMDRGGSTRCRYTFKRGCNRRRRREVGR